MKVIDTKRAPAAIGPYVQAIQAGEFLYISGQLPIDSLTGDFSGDDIVSQTKQSLTNIQEIVVAAGADLTKIVKINIYLKNMNDFVAMNQVYSEFFKEHKPARAAVEVSRLPKDALIEIEATAYLGL